MERSLENLWPQSNTIASHLAAQTPVHSPWPPWLSPSRLCTETHAISRGISAQYPQDRPLVAANGGNKSYALWWLPAVETSLTHGIHGTDLWWLQAVATSLMHNSPLTVHTLHSPIFSAQLTLQFTGLSSHNSSLQHAIFDPSTLLVSSSTTLLQSQYSYSPFPAIKLCHSCLTQAVMFS